MPSAGCDAQDGALVHGEAIRVEADRTVRLADETAFTARAVVLATRADYAVPSLPGLDELWGRP
jgi:thioredoxin reductase